MSQNNVESVLFEDIFDKPVLSQFDSKLRSSDGGASLLGAIDRRIKLTEDLCAHLIDERDANYKQLGRRLLNRVATIVTPDTIMRWNRRLIAAKWTFEPKRSGRRSVMKAIKKLVVRIARANSTWGYTPSCPRIRPTPSLDYSSGAGTRGYAPSRLES